MSRYKQVDRENQMLKIRKRLLRAAAAEFASQGYERANVDSISMAAGYAKGTIYNYFATKRALLLELIAEIAARHFEFVAGQVLQVDNPVHRLERFFDAGFTWVAENPNRAKVMIAALHGPDVEFKNHMAAGYQAMFELVSSDILSVGIRQGIFRPVELTSTARLLMTLYQGIASQLDEQGKPWLTPVQVAEFALSAIRANPPPSEKEG